MKICSQCKETKPETDFRKKLLGLQSYCRLCGRKYDSARYYRDREKRLILSKKMYSNNKEKRISQNIAYAKLHPEKAWARQTVRNAVISGKIIKKPCELCGDKRVQMHHEDYSKPLEVRFLCVRCHAYLHRRKDEFEVRNSYIRKNKDNG